MPFSLQEFKSWVQSVYHHDAHGTSWHMHTTSKIRVYNFSWTKSLLWTIRGQRQDADCWYFCLFKLFTHSETTLILVCGMLAVGVCRAVWRTDGMSQKPVQKHTTGCDSAAFFFRFFFFLLIVKFTVLIFVTRVTDHCLWYLFWAFVWLLCIQYNMVIIEENKPKTPYLYSNHCKKERAPFPVIAHTWESVPTSVLK